MQLPSNYKHNVFLIYATTCDKIINLCTPLVQNLRSFKRNGEMRFREFLNASIRFIGLHYETY